ncbi:MAG TPA: GNAT family N-acetyltransferase [Rectinemataceae bacterium]|nr:GNAT family N-acetyltransferase [Rectinemataceae bacterium]
MEIDSLAYRTDLTLAKAEGEVADRGDYLVVTTPSNPGFHWGNYLLFKRGPQDGDLARWEAIFDREIGCRLKVEHYAFGWDQTGPEPGCVGQVLAKKYNLNRSVVLTAREAHLPPKYNDEAVVRALRTDSEWGQALENQIACNDEDHEPRSFRAFKTRQMEAYRRMAACGQGWWFGAFIGDRLVADLGIFVTGRTARFQNVETCREHRREGICGTMVYESSRRAAELAGIDEFVMVADEDYHAARIYESVGFLPREHQYGLDWWKRGA